MPDVEITHSKVSAKSDGANTSLVRPSDWNAGHVVELASEGVVGVVPGTGAGPAAVIPWEDIIPTGVVLPYAGSAAPSAAWLLAAGQTVSRTTYAALFAVCGTTYNTGGEAGTDFRLPDLRGRVPAGKDNMGGSAASRLTNATAPNPDGATLGAAGGQQSKAITPAGTLAGTLTVSGTTGDGTGLVADSASAAGNTYSQSGHTHTFSANTSNLSGGTFTGTPETHGLVQPTLVLNYIIKV